MLLTKASEYALLSILRLKECQDPIDAQALSVNLGISRSFLAKILQRLTKAGILTSYKGMRGGFALAQDSADITVLDIIKAVEDNSPTVFECSAGVNRCRNNRSTTCHVWPIFYKLQLKIDDFLADISLDELCKKD